MSLPFKSVLICVSFALLSGCANTPAKVTKSYGAPLTFHSYQNPEVEVRAQAQALEDMAGDLVRRATLRGAATGAVVGCGTALIGAGGLKSCASSAVIAGGAGGIIGYRKGKKTVAETTQAAQIGYLDQHLAGMRGQADRLVGNLPAFLADQDAELAHLRSEMRAGRVSQETFDAKIAQIRISRSELAMALADSTADMVRARETMVDTSSRQSVDLHGQIEITREIETELFEARSAISLI